MRSDTQTFGRALVSLALAAVLVALATTGVAADTITVDDDGGADYTTIQAAVNAANPGDTIQVAAGTYAESVTVNKPLTLLGANAGIHPAVGTHPTETVGTRGPESILPGNFPALSPQADDITVDGFKFTGDGGRIVDTYADANNFHLTNCIFTNTVRATTQGVLQLGGGSHNDMRIDYNLFQDQGDHTIYTGGGPFDRIYIGHNRFNVLGDGVFWTATPLVDGVVEGNEFDGTIGGVPGLGGTGLNIGQGGNIAIRDNWFHDMSYTGFQVGIIGGSVTNNTFENTYPLDYSGTWYNASAFMLWGGQWGTAQSKNVVISGNTVKYNNQSTADADEYGIRVLDGCDAETIAVNCNDFLDGEGTATALALSNEVTEILNAKYNWWSDPSGPTHASNPGGSGGAVSDDVDFDPWLTGLVDDSDGDGLSCCEEMSLGTDPTNPDTDGDGVSDGMEIEFGTDPLDPSDFPAIGGITRPADPLRLLAPLVGLALVLMAGSTAFVWRRRSAR